MTLNNWIIELRLIKLFFHSFLEVFACISGKVTKPEKEKKGAYLGEINRCRTKNMQDNKEELVRTLLTSQITSRLYSLMA